MEIVNYGKIYRNYSFANLMKLKSFLMICKYPFLVRNLGSLYSVSNKVLGKNTTNNLIKFFYGELFVGGENPFELEKSLISLHKRGLVCIADYAREFLEEKEEKDIDNIIKAYKDSIDIAVGVNKNNSIALKISSFATVKKLKRLNELQFLLQLIENQYLLVGTNTDFSDYLELIKKYNLNCTTNLTSEDIGSFIKEIEKANLIFNGKQRIVSFELNLHEALIGKQIQATLNPISNNIAKNDAIENFIIKAFKLSNQEFSELSDYCWVIENRLKEVFEHAIKRNCSIMVDAEQSYIQHYFDFLTAHLFRVYNNNDSIVSTTLQCYLKMQMCRIMKWFEFCRENDLRVGMKLVRGAYLSEEKKLAEEGNYPNPICDSIEQTHENYNNSLKYVFEHLQDKEKVCIASHNIESIIYASDYLKNSEIKDRFLFAQLLGISEHATDICVKKNLHVGKYVPFGNFDILIPYLIRRAEESSMVSKLMIQNTLLNQEIYFRLTGLDPQI